MKKLFSLFLLLSFFVSSTSVLAVADNNNLDGQNSSSQEQGQEGAGQDQAAQAEKLQKDLQLFMSFQTAAFDQDEAGFEQEAQDFDQDQEEDSQNSGYKLNNNSKLNNETIIDRCKKIAKIAAISGAVIGCAAGAAYLAYKAGDKTGLNKEIKSLIEFVGKTKVLKNLVLGGIVGSAICTAIAGYIVYKYGQDFISAHALAMIIMVQMRQEQ